MSKLTSAEYRRMQHPDKQALLKQLERDPDDGSQSSVENLDDVLEVLGNSESGMIADVAAAITAIGSETGGLVKAVNDLEFMLDDSESGLIQAINRLLGIAMIEGTPNTEQAAPNGTLYDSNAADEILITSKVLGELHNGAKFSVVIPGVKQDDIAIDIEGDAYTIICKTKLVGESYVCNTTAAELVAVFNLDNRVKDAFLAEAKGTAATAIAAAGISTLAGGVDITVGEPGALRWDDAGKLWISLGQSTQTVNCWHYVQLVDPNA